MACYMAETHRSQERLSSASTLIDKSFIASTYFWHITLSHRWRISEPPWRDIYDSHSVDMYTRGLGATCVVSTETEQEAIGSMTLGRGWQARNALLASPLPKSKADGNI